MVSRLEKKIPKSIKSTQVQTAKNSERTVDAIEHEQLKHAPVLLQLLSRRPTSSTPTGISLGDSTTPFIKRVC